MSQPPATGIAARSLSGPPDRRVQVDLQAAERARAWLGEEVALELWAVIDHSPKRGKVALDDARSRLGLSAEDFADAGLPVVAAIFDAASKVADSGADLTMRAIRDEAANDRRISGELRRSGNLRPTDGLERFLKQRYKDNVAKYGATSRELRGGETFEQTVAAFARMNEITRTLKGNTRMGVDSKDLRDTQRFNRSILAASRDRQAERKANDVTADDAAAAALLLTPAVPFFAIGPAAGTIATCLSVLVGIGLKARQLASTASARQRSTKELIESRRDLMSTLSGSRNAR